ncbi:MAG: hypothetical protein AVO35_04570 [Candidatus Aegiribacteria sp. MLS_C]|nr:MAG: hypothetical protein AVO35_04570 [Candidatus Aegiribacteria sp. MLS_C]
MGQPLAVIDCALFAGNRPDIVREFAREGQVFQLQEGMTVRVQGRVSIWDRGGRYQLIVEDVDPAWSMGEQARKLRRLVDRLREEGVLEANSQLPLSPAPLRVGLITSRDSAAAHDFLEGLRDSRFPFEVFVSYASMQGQDTAPSVIRAFNRLLEIGGLDTVVLTRGGGSATDLAWFNNERIAGVISQVPWPVIAGIGHETDTTLPDFVSHTSVKTPTQCAEFLVNRVSDFADSIESLVVILQRSVTRQLSGAREVLSVNAAALLRTGVMVFRLERRRISGLYDILARNTLEKLLRCGSVLEELVHRLSRRQDAGGFGRRRRELHALLAHLLSSVRHRLAMASARLDGLNAALEAGDPANLYRRGWATVRKENGELLRSIGSIELGNRIEVTLRDGSLRARTDRIIPEGSRDDKCKQ